MLVTRLPDGRAEGAVHDDPPLRRCSRCCWRRGGHRSRSSDGRHDLFVTAALTIALKGLLIPWFLMRVIDRIGIHREIEPFLNVPASLLICLGLTVVGYRVSTGFPEGAHGVSHHLIGVALSMLLIGLFLMVTRKKAITQILALLTVENAVFLVARRRHLRHAAHRRAGDLVRRDPGGAASSACSSTASSDRFESMDVSRLSKLKG